MPQIFVAADDVTRIAIRAEPWLAPPLSGEDDGANGAANGAINGGANDGAINGGGGSRERGAMFSSLSTDLRGSTSAS